jgi:hypothetical protein
VPACTAKEDTHIFVHLVRLSFIDNLVKLIGSVNLEEIVKVVLESVRSLARMSVRDRMIKLPRVIEPRIKPVYRRQEGVKDIVRPRWKGSPASRLLWFHNRLWPALGRRIIAVGWLNKVWVFVNLVVGWNQCNKLENEDERAS